LSQRSQINFSILFSTYMDTQQGDTLTATCHCKAVRVTFPVPQVALNECLCSICLRYGGAWAYFSKDQVKIEGDTDTYSFGGKNRTFNRCQKCGCVTHWWPLDDSMEMGVNARQLDREDFEKFTVEKSEGPP
jgi:hypothetical protein